MKVKKILKIIFVLVILFTFTLILYLNNTVKLNNFEIQLANTKRIEQKDVYDVILFFGQSNMAGNMTQGIETRYQLDNQASVKEYSEKTGISEDLINQSWVSNYTVPKIDKETCYEYHVLDNSLYDLYDLTSNGYTANGAEITVNKFNGELVYYDDTTNKFYSVWSTDLPDYINKNSYTFSNAYGTNMVNEFAKVYYEKTGHKVVCVNAALGGQSLEHFVPNNSFVDANGTRINLYSAMSSKYLSAIEYLEKNNMKIGNRYFIMFQGEHEVGFNSNSVKNTYKENFRKIKNQLKSDLDIEKGAIVLTGYYPGEYNGASYAEGVKAINEAQRELIDEDSNIVLGSDFPYKHYVPGRDDYNNTSLYDFKSNMNQLDYDTALEYSKLVVGGEYDDNLFHFTSAALAQIGRETANNLCNENTKIVSNLSISLDSTEYTYIGKEIKPKVTVKDGNIILTENVDYIVEYENNINAGTGKVIVTGKGIYEGKKEILFNIKKAQIEIETAGYNGIYDGKEHGISIKVISPNEGYEIKYGVEEGKYIYEESPKYKEPGKYVVYYEISAQNYETKKGSNIIEIEEKEIEEEKKEFEVEIDKNDFVYTGKEIKPKVTVKDGNIILIENVDYTVEYKNNVNAGTGKVIVTGKGTYEGKKEILFNIKKAQMEIETVGYKGIYDEKEHGISIKVISPKEGYEIKYGIEEGKYIYEESPKYKEPGKYVVYYEISAQNYETKRGSSNIEIEERKNISVEVIEYNGCYDRKEHGIEIKLLNPQDAKIKYGLENGIYDLDTSPKFINAGEYTVYYQVTSENYNTTTGSAKVIIDRKDIATSTIEIENLDKIISGEDKNANVIVKDDNVTLVQSVDYNGTFNIDYNKQILTITIDGINNYHGLLKKEISLRENNDNDSESDNENNNSNNNNNDENQNENNNNNNNNGDNDTIDDDQDDNNSSIKNDNFNDDENDYEYDDTIAKDPIPFAGITKKIVLGFIVILSIVAVRSIIKYIKIDY